MLRPLGADGRKLFASGGNGVSVAEPERRGGGGGREPTAAGDGTCEGVAGTGACDGDEGGTAAGEDTGAEARGALPASGGKGVSEALGLEGRMEGRLPTGRGGFGLFWLFASSAIGSFDGARGEKGPPRRSTFSG